MTMLRKIKKITNNKVILITTKGCEGCAIARKLIKEAIDDHSKTISFEQQTLAEFGRRRLTEMKIKDFPAILFYKDDVLVHKHIGTAPLAFFLRWFDVYFD